MIEWRKVRASKFPVVVNLFKSEPTLRVCRYNQENREGVFLYLWRSCESGLHET